MIAVLPQTEHPHRNANGEAGAPQWQFESGCFIGGALLMGLGLDLNRRGNSTTRCGGRRPKRGDRSELALADEVRLSMGSLCSSCYR